MSIFGICALIYVLMGIIATVYMLLVWLPKHPLSPLVCHLMGGRTAFIISGILLMQILWLPSIVLGLIRYIKSKIR